MNSSEGSASRVGWVVVVLLSLGILVICCAIVIGVVWLTRDRSAEPASTPVNVPDNSNLGYGVGDVAMDFSLNTPKGDEIRLSDYRGRAVILNFWATWCGYCIEEFPLIETYMSLYSGQLEVLAVEQGSSLPDIQNFLLDNPFPFVFLTDFDYAVGDAYGVIYIPYTFFLDAEGVIRMVYEGTLDQQTIEEGIHAAGLE